MGPSTEDEHLGSKHKQYNKQVQDVIASGMPLDEKEIAKDKNDFENLMKIDIASHNRDIASILSVLKSDDMLYISRAIKQSIWIMDNQYADVINPTYLKEHIFPYMKTRAASKLLKHIRQHLKDENRVEEFYKNETSPNAAVKWLSRCSISFIENNVARHMTHIKDVEFKRLCERSVTVFEAAVKERNTYSHRLGHKMQVASFLLHTHPDKYLDVFESIGNRFYDELEFGPIATELIMKKAPGRVINNFIMYVKYIHVPTFIDNIKREQIKGFLFELAENQQFSKYSYGQFHRNLKHFVKRMPKEEQFDFVKQVFIDEDNYSSLQKNKEMLAIRYLCTNPWNSKDIPIYQWYEFAPFDTAFEEIKKLIQIEKNNSKKYSMLYVLLKCAAENTTDLLALLVYYFQTSIKDNIGQKRGFINKLIKQAKIYKRDEETWNAFMEEVNSMNINTDDNDQEYVQIIILHEVLQNMQVAEISEKRFTFDTLIGYRKTLNLDDQNKVFEYLYNYLIKKLKGPNIQTEIEFTETIQIMLNLLDLLLDWDKELSDYPFALNKIKELVRIRKDNAWKTSLLPLYNKKKSWKRLMFEESVVLNPTQEVCVNALKHDPNLLKRYKTEVDAICSEDTISMKKVLKKLRIYWPNTLADSWTKSYLDRLDNHGSHKALTRGLCTLLPQEPLCDIIKRFAPAQSKIDWNNTNELTLGLQRSFAKNMHIARPQPSADAILLYAKGDFLQYALPSLLAIYYNMGRVESEKHIPKLLNSPVSLQKHGLRLAFIKLNHQELKLHLSNMWKTSKNISIRAVTFVLLFDLMCKEKDAAKAEELWEILEVFINNLSFKEDKKIYLKLKNIENVPEKIRPRFLIKSYTFLKSLLPHIKNDINEYEDGIKKLALYTRNIMEFMCPEFITNIISEYLNAALFQNNFRDTGMLGVISSYFLCAKEEKTQHIKYEKMLAPTIKTALTQWKQYDVRKNVENLLMHFYRDLFEYVIKNKMIVPTNMFKNIEKELAKLDLRQNYLIIRMWMLVVKITEIIEKTDNREDWFQVQPIMVPEFGKFCLKVLKEDVEEHFPCIYILFARALSKTIHYILPHNVVVQIFKVLLSDEHFIPAYLVVLSLLSDNNSDERFAEEIETKKLICDHTSVEVRMHYYSKYNKKIGPLLGI